MLGSNSSSLYPLILSQKTIVNWIQDFSPSGSSKSTGMIEVHNRLLEHVQRRTSGERDWDSHLEKDSSDVNQRIISYLDLSPSDLLFGPVK